MKLLGKIAGWFGKREAAPQEQPSPAVRAQLSSIDECACCKLPLPLRLPKQGERVGNWQCVQCGYRYVAVIDEHRHPDLLAHIRPVAGDGAAKSGDSESDNGKDVDAFVSDVQADRERRLQKRSPLETILLVTPLDADKRETGDAFLCRTADLSATGIRLSHAEPIEAKWLWLEHLSPQSEQIRVMVQVTRIRVRENGCEIGAQFANQGDGRSFATDEQTLFDTPSKAPANTLPAKGVANAPVAGEAGGGVSADPVSPPND